MQKSSVLKLFGLFLALFLPILGSWIYIKDYYNRFITNLAFELGAHYYDLRIVDSTTKDGSLVFHIKNSLPMRDIAGKSHDFELEAAIDMEAVTFNVPMTLALLLAIILTAGIPFRKKREIVFKGVLFLFLLHIGSMLLFSLCTIAEIAQTNPYIHFYLSRHYLAGEALCALKDFLINYAARFEPFLIALYAWFEIHRQKISERAADRPPSTPKSPA